jgi:hypothetical protein
MQIYSAMKTWLSPLCRMKEHFLSEGMLIVSSCLLKLTTSPAINSQGDISELQEAPNQTVQLIFCFVLFYSKIDMKRRQTSNDRMTHIHQGVILE